MTNNNMDVVGYAVYFEFRKQAQTWQMLITPESREASMPASMFRRRLNPAQPRKMWKQIASTTMANVAVTAPGSLADSPESRLGFVKAMLDSLILNGWKIYRQPIVVECTNEDMQHVRLGKAPYKIIGRVLKSRKALRFPDKLFGEVSE